MSDLDSVTPERLEGHADWLTAEAQGYDDTAGDANEREATRRHAAEDATDCREVADVLRAVAALRRARAAHLRANANGLFQNDAKKAEAYAAALRAVEGP